jgi:hypothetical protein
MKSGITNSNILFSNKKESMNDTILADNYLQELQRQWQEQDTGALLMYALSFLDVKSLFQKEIVSKTWRQLIKDIIDAKCGQDGPKAFQSKQELGMQLIYIANTKQHPWKRLHVLMDIP